MTANESRPDRPVEKTGFPENRIYMRVDGLHVKIGNVVTVGSGDDWENVASAAGINPWELIYANFETTNPREVNWYLREYVGCSQLGPRGQNYTFKNADPGRIFVPWQAHYWILSLERELQYQKKRDEEKSQKRLLSRWPDLKKDIVIGREIVESIKHTMHKDVSDDFWNANSFTLEDKVVSELRSKLAFLPINRQEAFNMGAERLLQEFFKRGLKETHGAPPGIALVKEVFIGWLKEGHMQKHVSKLRTTAYRAYTAGIAASVFDQTSAGRLSFGAMKNNSERYFFRKGQALGKTLRGLKKYQFIVGLIDSNRLSGMKGFEPAVWSKWLLKDRYNAASVSSMLYQSMLHNKYKFRNVTNVIQRRGWGALIPDKYKDKVVGEPY